MLRVCSVCDSNINFSINADTDIREFAAMSSRPVSRVQQRLFELGLEGFVQERGSAKKDYIPPFNLEGVSI